MGIGMHEDAYSENVASFSNLIFDHHLMTLHHNLKFVPASAQLSQLVHAATSHRAEQLVLLLCRCKLWLYLQQRM